MAPLGAPSAEQIERRISDPLCLEQAAGSRSRHRIHVSKPAAKGVRLFPVNTGLSCYRR